MAKYMPSRSIIVQVCWKHIGDGASTRIEHDPWLLDLDEPYIQTQISGFNLQMVSDLMLDRTWNSDLIQPVFKQCDVDWILQIPLSIYSR